MAHEKNKRPKRYGRRYPWESWFAQKCFTLNRDQDFNGRAYTMAQQVRNAAGRLGTRVSIKVADDESRITVTLLDTNTVQQELAELRAQKARENEQKARENEQAKRCGLPHNQYVLLKALEDGKLHTYRDLVMRTGVYSNLPVEVRARWDGSLGRKGLLLEECWVIEGERVNTFQITAKGKEVLAQAMD